MTGYQLPRPMTGNTMFAQTLPTLLFGGTVVIGSGWALTMAGPRALTGIIPAVTLTALVLFGRIGNTPIRQWTAIATGHLRRRRTWLTPLHPDTTAVPPYMEGLDIGDLRDRDGHTVCGGIADRQQHTITTMVRVAGQQLLLEPAGVQHTRLAGWGNTLAQLVDDATGITTIIVNQWRGPGSTDAHHQWIDNNGGHINPDSPYATLLATMASTETDTVIALTIDTTTVRRGKGETAWEAAARSATQAAQGLVWTLRQQHHHADTLDAADIWRHIASRTTPQHPARTPTDTDYAAQPAAVANQWNHLQTDDQHHRSLLFTQLPRSDVGAIWATRLADQLAGHRTLTTVFTPTSMTDAWHRIETDLTRLDAEADARAKAGFRISARHQRLTAEVLQREHELSDGHAELGINMLLQLTATTLDQLDDAETDARRIAAQAGCTLRRLDGQHNAGMCTSIGLARGIA